MKQKLLVCLLVGLVCGATFLRLANRCLPFIPPPVNLGLSLAILFGSIATPFIWRNNDERFRAFWIGALRYGIAFDLAAFGIHKFFGFQFVTPLAMLDIPFSEFSDRWLMWAYFGRSFGFISTIAIIQIIGSLMLVFNRTRLLAVIVLLPVMLNIIFLDYFYDLEFGVLSHALILFAGLLYLLFLDYSRLVEFFLKHVPEEKEVINFAGKISIIVVPLLLGAFVGKPDKHPQLTGKYKVEVTHDPLCGDSVLSTVYFDIGECVFEFNSLKRRVHGEYTLNGDSVNVLWHYPPVMKGKEFKGAITRTSDNTIELNGDAVQVMLKKLDR